MQGIDIDAVADEVEGALAEAMAGTPPTDAHRKALAAMAVFYATTYADPWMAGQLAEALGGEPAWAAMGASERARAVARTALAHAMADDDLAADRFGDRMRESAREQAHRMAEEAQAMRQPTALREEGQGALAASHALPNGGRGTREASPRGR